MRFAGQFAGEQILKAWRVGLVACYIIPELEISFLLQ